LAEVYALVADTWSVSAAPPLPEHLGVVIEGINRFPRDMALLTQAAMLAIRRGFPAEARAMVERGVKLARQPAERDRFQLLLAGLESTPAALPPSKAGSDTTQESFLERSISLRRPDESKAGTPPPAPASKSPVSK
jgi:hypothetical protein